MSDRDKKDRLPIEGVVPAGVGGQAFVPRDDLVPDAPTGEDVDEVIADTPLPETEVAADPPEGDDGLTDPGSPEFDHSLRQRKPS
jgi:hypothetical protein